MDEKEKAADAILKEAPQFRLTESNETGPSSSDATAGNISYEFGLKPLDAAPSSPSSDNQTPASETKADALCAETAPPPVAQSSNSQSPQPASEFEKYEYESVCKAAHTLIDRALKSKTPDVADIASRLLVDISEHKIAPEKARLVLGSLEQTLSHQSPHENRTPLNKGIVLASVAACLALLLIWSAFGVKGIHNRIPRASTSRTHMLPAAWQYLPVDQVGAVRSLNGFSSTGFTITNKRADRVNVYWLNYQSDPVFYMTLNPGETRVQQTYATHPWLVRDEDNTNLLLFVAGTNQMEQITVK